MSIRVSELPVITDYQKLKKSDKILFSQGELNTLVTKNLDLSSLEMYLSSKAQPEIAGIRNSLSSYSTVGHRHMLSDITNFESHTHEVADIVDFEHTHTRDQITDFEHVHTMDEITDLSDQTHTMADITDIDVLIDQINDISDDLTAVQHHSQNLTSADIKDFDKHVHIRSQIVDFKHEHEISEIVSLSTYVNGQISGLTVPRICDLGEIDNIALSTNTVVISRPNGKNLSISRIGGVGDGVQRHFYLYVINQNENTVLLRFSKNYNFRACNENALDVVSRKSDVLLEFVEIGKNLFFVIRNESETINPATTNKYFVYYPINVDENGYRRGSVEPENHEYDEKYEFIFPEPESIDEYTFDYWYCRGVKYEVGSKLEIIQDEDLSAVYTKNKCVRFVIREGDQLLRRYRIEHNRTIYLESENGQDVNEEVEKMEFPKTGSAFEKYHWSSNVLPDVESMSEDVYTFYCDVEEIEYKEDPDIDIGDDDGDGEEDNPQKDDEESDFENILLLQTEPDISEEHNRFGIDANTYMTLV